MKRGLHAVGFLWDMVDIIAPADLVVVVSESFRGS